MPAVVEEVNRQTGGSAGGSAVELSSECRQIFVAGRDGRDIHKNGADLFVTLLDTMDEGTRELVVGGRGGVLGRGAGGEGSRGWGEEAVADPDAVVLRPRGR